MDSKYCIYFTFPPNFHLFQEKSPPPLPQASKCPEMLHLLYVTEEAIPNECTPASNRVLQSQVLEVLTLKIYTEGWYEPLTGLKQEGKGGCFHSSCDLGSQTTITCLPCSFPFGNAFEICFFSAVILSIQFQPLAFRCKKPQTQQ